ncbi:MAG: NUDIX domain-containing protein, partial [Bryobacteraceae bacterium]
HVEPQDPTVFETARREVIEETGAFLEAGEESKLVGIDVHPIPSNGREPLHLHHDLIFVFQAQSKEFECSPESREVVWCRMTEFDRYELPGSIRRSVLRAASDKNLRHRD